ncbi:MAG: DUF5677 domain-containing protein [Bacteroidales bacterium]
MTKEQLRTEYLRLSRLETIKDCLDLFDIFIEHLWNVMTVHHKDKVYSFPNKDAKFINQMLFSKLINLKKLVEGVGYTARNGEKLNNNIIDPTIVASLTRTIFETVSVFNLIYRNTKNEDEKVIIYGLWVISGLKYRQRFEPILKIPENIHKIKDEQREIELVEKEIKETVLYKSLDAKNQLKIDKQIKQNDYKIRFKGKNVINLAWRDMCNVMELNKDVFYEIYTYFSLYAHPSYVSVFQFETMFSKEKEEFKQLTTTNLKYCFILVSVFIADYIYIFPAVKKTFEKLEIYKQIAIDSFNATYRGRDFSINEVLKNLE